MFLCNGDQLYSAWGCSYTMGISCTVHGDVLIQRGPHMGANYQAEVLYISSSNVNAASPVVAHS